MLSRGTEGVNKNKLITRRMFMLSAAKVVVFTGIISRLFTLQISENQKYSFLSDKNRLRKWKLPPKRGVIEDYFGVTIADNNQVFQLHMIPEEVENFNYLILRLKNIIQLDKKDIDQMKNYLENLNIFLKGLQRKIPRRRKILRIWKFP